MYLKVRPAPLNRRACDDFPARPSSFLLSDIHLWAYDVCKRWRTNDGEFFKQVSLNISLISYIYVLFLSQSILYTGVVFQLGCKKIDKNRSLTCAKDKRFLVITSNWGWSIKISVSW